MQLDVFHDNSTSAMTTHKMSFVDILHRLASPIGGGLVVDYCCGEDVILRYKFKDLVCVSIHLGGTINDHR